MTTGRTHRRFREIEAEYFRNHPDEIMPYMEEVFEEYAKDDNSEALRASLQVIAKIKGVENHKEMKGDQLSKDVDQPLEKINALMKAMGYRLVPEKIDLLNK